MLAYNEIKPRKYINLDEEPYEVLSSLVFRKQARKPVNQTKLKNLITGKVLEVSFHQSDKVEEAELSNKKAIYLFSKDNRQTNQEEYWFSDVSNKSIRFPLLQDIVGKQIQFIKQNSEIEILYFKDSPIGIKLPIKINLKVKEAPPAIKGNTASGATKQVALETGATVTTPIFIKEGDFVCINTETGEYVSRVE